MRTRLPLLLITVLFFTFSSCVKEGADITYKYYDTEDYAGYAAIEKTLNLPETPMPYTNDFPSYYNGSTFPFDEDLATLGRVIFYDKALSSDGTVSCASCHDQAAAFADNKKFSDGVEGRVTTRNSLALGSVFSFNEYYGSISLSRVPFFWDNRASNVQDQSRETFANAREMKMEMHDVVREVNDPSRPYYRPLIYAASRGSYIADEYIVLEAISVFVNSISSFNSPYDDALSAYYDDKGHIDDIDVVDLPLLSPIENEGKNFYMSNCASCHGATNGFPGELMANNGLDKGDEANVDEGMGGVSGYDNEKGIFKVPTLRNITLTAPYMHDGRFATIDDVLDHYDNSVNNNDTGIKNNPNLTSPLVAGGMDMTADDRVALKAFFETFVDNTLLTAEKYADPFIQ